MTVYENLAFPLRNRGVADAEIDARVREIAVMLDLTATLDDMDFELAKKRPATSCLFPHTALQLRCTRRERTM